VIKEMIPIVFIHKGNQNYLKYAIESAKENGLSVYLLGNQSNEMLTENWRCISECIDKRFKLFEQLYVHMSSNSEKFELGCFERYFALLGFMRSEKIDRCIMLDSDVLVCYPIDQLEFIKSSTVAFSVPEKQNEFEWVASPHVFSCTVEMLKKFVEFLLITYTEHIDKLTQKFQYHIKHSIKGGVCDMSLLYLWSQEIEYFNLYHCKTIFFDHTVQNRQNFKWDTVLMMKKIYRRNNEYFFLSNDINCKQHVAVIHFQGSTKSVMGCFYNNQGMFKKLSFRYTDFAKRLIRRMK
jgi:hypothetical protein